MSIFIVGANGFVGRNLREYFQARYENVLVPLRAELDLCDSVAVEKYLSTHKPDFVVHCAVTLTSVEQNLKMYFNIERCSEFFGKMVVVGSGAEYDGRHYVPGMKEELFGKQIPTDIYGFSRYVVAKDIEQSSKNIFNLRVLGIYGKHENYTRRFISNNICRVLANQNISMRRNMKFDYLYIHDFCKILENFLLQTPKCKSYNVCTSRPIDLYSLAQMVRDVDGKNREIVVQQDGMNPEYSGDNTRYLSEFGPFSFIDHRVAVEELYDWYKNKSQIKFNELSF